MAMILITTSRTSSIDMSEAPKNKERAPPKVFRNSKIVGYCLVSFTSSTSSVSKKILIWNRKMFDVNKSYFDRDYLVTKIYTQS
jgi:hypothetical protein